MANMCALHPERKPNASFREGKFDLPSAFLLDNVMTQGTYS